MAAKSKPTKQPPNPTKHHRTPSTEAPKKTTLLRVHVPGTAPCMGKDGSFVPETGEQCSNWVRDLESETAATVRGECKREEK